MLIISDFHLIFIAHYKRHICLNGLWTTPPKFMKWIDWWEIQLPLNLPRHENYGLSAGLYGEGQAHKLSFPLMNKWYFCQTQIPRRGCGSGQSEIQRVCSLGSWELRRGNEYSIAAKVNDNSDATRWKRQNWAPDHPEFQAGPWKP